jgi:PAS domain S-box-containing protein
MRNPEPHRPEEARQEEAFSPAEICGGSALDIDNVPLNGEANQEMNESGKRYRQLVHELPAAIYTTDAEGRITLFNAAAAELWGRAPKIGEDQWCGSYRIYRPDGTFLPHDQCPMALALKEGREINGAEILVEGEDGSRRSVLAHPRPLRDASGAIIGALNMLVDITDRKQAEIELAETKNDLILQVDALTRLHQLALWLAGPLELNAGLHAILEALVEIHDAQYGLVALYDRNSGCLGIVADVSFDEDATLNLSRIIAQPKTSVSAYAFVTCTRAVVEDLESDPRFGDFRETGRTIGFRAVHSVPILTRAGDALGVISVHFKTPRRPTVRELQFADLCARYAAETIESARIQEALRESEQKLRDQTSDLEQQLIASGRLVSLGEVTASMAHEFNNPLGIIIGFVEDMLGNAELDNPDYRSLEIVYEESKRCKKIVEDLMEYARPRSAAISMIAVPIIIEKTLELVEAHCYKQKVEVIKNADPLLPQIHADAQQLTQVLVNLYLNAIDAMPEGGTLRVSTRASDESKQATVIISVADTGVGIEESEMGKIFQPFYTAKKRRGLGLGLPICERIVKNHGGEIKVQSRPGLGTTFEIHLPAEPNPAKRVIDGEPVK